MEYIDYNIKDTMKSSTYKLLLANVKQIFTVNTKALFLGLK